MKPLWSIKAMLACFSALFFYPPPIAIAPAANGSFVLLPGSLLRLLAAPAQLAEQLPNVSRVIPYAELTFDHLCHAGTGPQIVAKTGRLRTGQQDTYQLLVLRRIQERPLASLRSGPESLQSPFPDRFSPTPDAWLRRPHGGCHLRYRITLQQHPPRNTTADFQYLCASFGSHTQLYASRHLSFISKAGFNSPRSRTSANGSNSPDHVGYGLPASCSSRASSRALMDHRSRRGRRSGQVPDRN